MQLAGMLAVTDSLLAAAEKRGADIFTSLDYATELAGLTGEANAFWFGFGPANVGVWRMAVALEAGDHEQAAATFGMRRAEMISPARVHRHPFIRETLAELVTRARRDAAGRELRGMAYRAGLSV